MIDLKPESSLKRGIPISRFYIEVKPGGIEIRVRGSRMPGVYVSYLTILQKTPSPSNGPAKCSNGFDYLKWIADKQDRRKGKKAQ